MDVKRCVLLSLVLALAAVSAAQLSPQAQVQARFREWNAALESVAVDFVAVPKGDDIQALAAYLVEHGYWEEPVLYDPWGNLYRFSSDGKHYSFSSLGPDGRLSTADDLSVRGAVFAPLSPLEEKPAVPASSSFSYSSPRSTGDSLRLSKSGYDILFTWSGTGTLYDIAGAIDAKFLNAYLLLNNYSGSSYTYTNALRNPKTVEFFDVTDETEVNHGADGNGLLPPEPPQLTTISASPFIGGTGTITGTGFSAVKEDNLICFTGGYCITPDTATTTQLDFKVPPGAISGPFTVSTGDLDSPAMDAVFSLEDTALPAMTVRSLGFVPSMGNYYAAVLEGGTNKIMRLYYDSGTGKWARENRTGSYTLLHYGAPAADAAGNMFFGQAQQSTGGGGTRKVVTNPPTNAANCFTIPSGGNSVRVVGIAADPNPDGIPGRDRFYALFEDVTASLKYVKQMYTDCSGIADGDWGNQSGSWNWNALNGAAVDPKTGDLYVAEKTAVRVVRFATEAVENFKSGFATNIYNIAVWRDPGTNFGLLVVGDFGAGQIRTVPLDNPTASATTLATGSTTRAVSVGLTTYEDSAFTPAVLARLLVLHNDGSTIKTRKEPYLKMSTDGNPYVRVWISSPEGSNDRATFQGSTRISYNPASTDYSTLQFSVWWADDQIRPICAMMGDALSVAKYEPRPSPIPAACFKPWKDPITGAENGLCDNHESFALSGVGSSTANNDFKDCRTTCGTASNPCTFNFRITQHWGGDTYRPIIFAQDTRTYLGGAKVNPWKRIYIEKDKMCKRGGILDGYLYFAGGDGDSDPDFIWVRQWDQGLSLDDPSYPQLGDTAKIFDSDHTFESGGEDAVIQSRVSERIPDLTDLDCTGMDPCSNPDCTCRWALKFGLDRDLVNTYWSSRDEFQNGKSAGVCVSSQGYYQVNTTRLNKLDQTGPFDDAFVQFKTMKEGQNVVPYLHTTHNDGLIQERVPFHQYWFSKKKPIDCQINPPQNCIGCCNTPQNIFHLIGSSNAINSRGVNYADSDISYVYEAAIKTEVDTFCGSTTCYGDELENYICFVSSHEPGHNFRVNPCRATQGQHCINLAWCGGAGGACRSRCNAGEDKKCTMHGMTNTCQRSDGISRFECSDLCAHPMCMVLEDCSLPGGLSIRTNTDPE